MSIIKNIKKYNYEIIGSIACLSLGMLSGYLSHLEPTAWYKSLHKPSYTPADWVFSPVWTILYIMIGTAFGKLWRNRTKYKIVLYWFATQFLLNIIWSPLFFGLHRIDLALLDIILLWISLVILLIITHHSRTIFMLLVPYFLWVSFATILNLNIYFLNPIY